MDSLVFFEVVGIDEVSGIEFVCLCLFGCVDIYNDDFFCFVGYGILNNRKIDVFCIKNGDVGVFFDVGGDVCGIIVGGDIVIE